jgi:hypothetical protein
MELPPQPTSDDYPEYSRFTEATQAWKAVCLALIAKIPDPPRVERPGQQAWAAGDL